MAKISGPKRAWLERVKGTLKKCPEADETGKLSRLLGKTVPMLAVPLKELLDGYLIEGYRLGRLIGLGSEGLVYEATDPEGAPRAMKIVPWMSCDETTEEEATLLRREAEICRRLRHPSIVLSYDALETDFARFLAMERIQGRPLSELIGEPWAKIRCREIFGPLAEALQYAHDHGVVHRDLKPDNVMLTDDGGVKILDFGLASLRGGTRVTLTGQLKGTPLYAAPEQIENAKEVTVASDQFSYGVMAFQTVSGEFPYQVDHKDTLQALYKRLQEPALTLRSILPNECRRLEAVLARMLDRDPEARYPRIQDAFQALAETLK